MVQLDTNNLRERLAAILINEEKSITEIAQEIGIDRTTLNRFIQSSSDRYRKSLVKIKNYVERKEKGV